MNPPDRTVPAHVPGEPPGARRAVTAAIMCLEMVGHSTHAPVQQTRSKARLDDLLGKTLRGIEASSRVTMDTGHGAAICFTVDPAEALRSALLLRGLLLQAHRGTLLLRIGLHLGPVRILAGPQDRVNVVGDGINVAQRVMDFAQANQVVASRAYHDEVVRLTGNGAAGTASTFRHLGPHLDKHLRSHDIYAVLP